MNLLKIKFFLSNLFFLIFAVVLGSEMTEPLTKVQRQAIIYDSAKSFSTNETDVAQVKKRAEMLKITPDWPAAVTPEGVLAWKYWGQCYGGYKRMQGFTLTTKQISGATTYEKTRLLGAKSDEALESKRVRDDKKKMEKESKVFF